MDAAAHQALIDEWTARGRSIAAFVTANVPADVVPVSVFDHGPDASGPDDDGAPA
ncbi:hypothetical protein [Curtobacterium pusillum]|uniref:hypothetical protein n=1 Tax=Curtobacterium pusillum TaxID=69373 RepID=UPI001643C205|nr:hypothetical protein [Curtobacterium pusillum]